MAIDIITASGTWTCPAGVTSATVFCVGGGAGGGTDMMVLGGRGGGGGGACSVTTVTTTPGNSYDVTVGAGGAADTAGADTSFFEVHTTHCLAKGGSADGALGGAGGAAASGTGDTKKSGGTGSAGSGNSGGGGGGAAYLGGDGNNGSVTAGGAATPDAIIGGAGGSGGTSGNNGVNGSNYGGGGGGAGLSGTGGTGANGVVYIVYYDASEDIPEVVPQGVTLPPAVIAALRRTRRPGAVAGEMPWGEVAGTAPAYAPGDATFDGKATRPPAQAFLRRSSLPVQLNDPPPAWHIAVPGPGQPDDLLAEADFVTPHPLPHWQFRPESRTADPTAAAVIAAGAVGSPDNFIGSTFTARRQAHDRSHRRMAAGNVEWFPVVIGADIALPVELLAESDFTTPHPLPHWQYRYMAAGNVDHTVEGVRPSLYDPSGGTFDSPSTRPPRECYEQLRVSMQPVYADQIVPPDTLFDVDDLSVLFSGGSVPPPRAKVPPQKFTSYLDGEPPFDPSLVIHTTQGTRPNPTPHWREARLGTVADAYPIPDEVMVRGVFEAQGTTVPARLRRPGPAPVQGEPQEYRVPVTWTEDTSVTPPRRLPRGSTLTSEVSAEVTPDNGHLLGYLYGEAATAPRRVKGGGTRESRPDDLPTDQREHLGWQGQGVQGRAVLHQHSAQTDAGPLGPVVDGGTPDASALAWASRGVRVVRSPGRTLSRDADPTALIVAGVSDGDAYTASLLAWAGGSARQSRQAPHVTGRAQHSADPRGDEPQLLAFTWHSHASQPAPRRGHGTGQSDALPGIWELDVAPGVAWQSVVTAAPRKLARSAQPTADAQSAVTYEGAYQFDLPNTYLAWAAQSVRPTVHARALPPARTSDPAELELSPLPVEFSQGVHVMPPRRLRPGHAQHSEADAVAPELTNVVIVGAPFYVVAGEIYVAGAVAYQVQTE